MIYKKIALCFLFFSSQLFCMLVNPIKIRQISKRRQKPEGFSYEQLSKDILQRNHDWNHQFFAQKPDTFPVIIKFLDFQSNAQLFASCKQLYEMYKNTDFALSPKKYMNAMIHASQAGDKEQVGLFIKRENELDKKQRESILRCFKVNYFALDNPRMIVRIYGKKYDIECEDFIKLETGVEFGQLARNPLLCQLLLEQGISPNIHGGYCLNDRLITDVIGIENLELLKLLLGHESMDPNKEAHSGKTPLMIAIEKKNSEAIKLLLGHKKIDPNKETTFGKTPLIIAINKGNLEAIKFLLEDKRIDQNKKGKHGWTPLQWAVCKGNPEAVKILLENGADANNCCGHDFPSYYCSKDSKITKLLLQYA